MSSTKNINVNVIKQYVSTLPHSSGVYQMLNSNNKCLYVGKAKDLAKRVKSYTNVNALSERMKRMVAETTQLQHIVTHNEAEALLLEADLIKSLKPKYNILLRDDKSFPYLGLSLKHPYPRLFKIKTKDITSPDLFGPFANSQNLDTLLSLLQQTFKLRVCSDNTFKNRVKPCIYYQIKRCSAPCVNKIAHNDYSENVCQSIELLKGNANQLKSLLEDKMHVASDEDNFELAILYRDRLRLLSNINLNYSVIPPESSNIDVITIKQQENKVCIQLIKFTNNRSMGIFHYFPEHIENESLDRILSNFIIQYYKNRELPVKIVTNVLPYDKALLIKALKLLYKQPITIQLPTKAYQEVMRFAETNTEIALNNELHSAINWSPQFQELENISQHKIQRIEIFDNSHFNGSNMLGVMVVANRYGFSKKDYRIFKLRDKTVNQHDDYGTFHEVLTRRLHKLDKIKKEYWPSLLIIDGGVNQLKVALKLLDKYNLREDIKAISVAKDKTRTFGNEKIIADNLEPLTINKSDEVFKFILKLRDEAHRFAINTQRKASLKQSTASILDNIPGVGKARKQALLLHFGSINAIKSVSAEHIHNTTKIGKKLSKKILEWLH